MKTGNSFFVNHDHSEVVELINRMGAFIALKRMVAPVSQKWLKKKRKEGKKDPK